MVNHRAPVPIEAVLFDFHGTLVDGGDPDRWIAAARAEAAVAPAAGLGEHLRDIWRHAHTFDPGSERDLSADRHREVFGHAVALVPGVEPALIEALYAVMPAQWTAFADARPVLRELKARGIKVAVLSNIGLDVRECLGRNGLSDLIDEVVLSYEVGLVKPDPAIFAHALERLAVPAGRALMVGDSPRDDVGGAALGIRTLILPRTDGPVHGLGAVLALAGYPGDSSEPVAGSTKIGA